MRSATSRRSLSFVASANSAHNASQSTSGRRRCPDGRRRCLPHCGPAEPVPSRAAPSRERLETGNYARSRNRLFCPWRSICERMSALIHGSVIHDRGIERRRGMIKLTYPHRTVRMPKGLLCAHVASVAHLGATNLDRPNPGLDCRVMEERCPRPSTRR
jgi:hypothetical protein